jgi:hypothetical protein
MISMHQGSGFEHATITRRELVASAVILTPSLSAQTALPPEQELKLAREAQASASKQLRDFKIPHALEPSFSFRP